MGWVTQQGHPARSSHGSRAGLAAVLSCWDPEESPASLELHFPTCCTSLLRFGNSSLGAPKHQKNGFFTFVKTLKEFIKLFGRFHSIPLREVEWSPLC